MSEVDETNRAEDCGHCWNVRHWWMLHYINMHYACCLCGKERERLVEDPPQPQVLEHATLYKICKENFCEGYIVAVAMCGIVGLAYLVLGRVFWQQHGGGFALLCFIAVGGPLALAAIGRKS